MRAAPLLVVVSLTLVAFVGRADTALETDAGASAVVFDGSAHVVSGLARGGAPPYAFAWSLGGDASRFADAGAASTTFATTGLAPGTVTLSFTVTDAAATTATDTVLLRIAASQLLLDRDIVIRAGVPDEQLLGTQLDRGVATFVVPAGLARLDGRLEWPDAASDLDLDLVAPDGSVASGQQGRTSARPEHVSVALPRNGVWQASVRAIESMGTTSHVTLRGFGNGTLPIAEAGSPLTFGRLDAMSAHASARGGVAPYSFAWDTDGDGWFDEAGADVAFALPVGEFSIAVRVTDAAGFEVTDTTSVTVMGVDHVAPFVCGGAPGRLWAMEYTASRGTCWIHGGHHTYFLGDGTFAFRGLEGYAFAVEQQFAPALPMPTDPLFTPMHVEVSEDGLLWTEVGVGRYQMVPTSAGQNVQRQGVTFDVAGGGERARFVRIHSPLSLSQGLSGYLDHTEGVLLLDEVGSASMSGTVAARDLTCETDLMEDFFLTHPCTFGGVDRYDAPSFFHTYFLGDGATLDRVSGTFTLLPWRFDDWTQGDTIANGTNTSAYLQTSLDGVAWTTRAQIPATNGVEQAFSVELGGESARFVRLFPEYHARFDQTAQFAPNHHPKGFFVHSTLHLEGSISS